MCWDWWRLSWVENFLAKPINIRVRHWPISYLEAGTTHPYSNEKCQTWPDLNWPIHYMKPGKEISECPSYFLEIMYQTGSVPDPRLGIFSLCGSIWMITEVCAVIFTLLDNYLVCIVRKKIFSLSGFIREGIDGKEKKKKQHRSFRFSPD